MKLSDRMRAAGVHGAPYTIAHIVAWAEMELDRIELILIDLDNDTKPIVSSREEYETQAASRLTDEPQDEMVVIDRVGDKATYHIETQADLVAQDMAAAHAMDSCSDPVPPVTPEHRPGVLERLRNGRWL